MVFRPVEEAVPAVMPGVMVGHARECAGEAPAEPPEGVHAGETWTSRDLKSSILFGGGMPPPAFSLPALFFIPTLTVG
jgi:hypothetical protein